MRDIADLKESSYVRYVCRKLFHRLWCCFIEIKKQNTPVFSKFEITYLSEMYLNRSHLDSSDPISYPFYIVVTSECRLFDVYRALQVTQS